MFPECFLDEETPLNHIGLEAFLSLFRWTDLREDFKEVLTDLFRVIAVSLANEPDGIWQQHIVRRIYDEYLAGLSPYTIAKQLTADGIPTPAH